MRSVGKFILAFFLFATGVFAGEGETALCESQSAGFFWKQEGELIIKRDSASEIVLGRGFSKPVQAVVHECKDIFVIKTASGSFWANVLGSTKMQEIGCGFSAGKMKFIGDKLWFANVRGELWKKDFSVAESKFECVWKSFTKAKAAALVAVCGSYLLASIQSHSQGEGFFHYNYQPWSQCLVDSDQCSSYEAEVFATLLPPPPSSASISGLFKVATAGSVVVGCVPCAVASGAAAFVSSYFQ
jgi:hypothetical protein